MMNLCLFAVVGGLLRETIALSAGWNAVYLESTPQENDATAFFSSLPVERVGCYRSSVYSPTEQLDASGNNYNQSPVAYTVWERGKEEVSTLKTVHGGAVYTLFATNSAEKSFFGVPQPPRTSWQISQDGFLTIAPVSVDKGVEVLASAYFREGPAGAALAVKPYTIEGTNPVSPDFIPNLFSSRPKVIGGRAYAFESPVAQDWPGVLEVTGGNTSGVLDFSTNVNQLVFSVRNAGTAARTVRVSNQPSAWSGHVHPALKCCVMEGGTNTAWSAFTTCERRLEAGARMELRLFLDRASVTDHAAEYASLIKVEDVDGGTQMRVFTPVAAAAGDDTPANAAFPKGIWLGKLSLSQVDNGPGTPFVAAAGVMKPQILLRVDGGNDVKLLQRVTVIGRRISAVFPDMAHQVLPAASAAFGDNAVFTWTVAADAVDNPFKHVWHPDHATGMPVTNRLTLNWRTEGGESTWSVDPNEVTYGIVEWKLGGLNAAGDITMRGTFALKRISDKLSEEE